MNSTPQVIIVRMVCSIRTGKMAAMVRNLAAGSFSQIVAEEVSKQKLTAKYVQRELLEADEANLLDEEEICKSLRFAEEIVSELKGGIGQRKPRRKDIKKLTSAFASMPSKEQERLESSGTNSKRNSSCGDGAPTKDGSEVCPEILGCSTDAITPPTKRSKSIPEAVDKLDHQRIAIDVVKSSCPNTLEAHNCREHLKGPIGRCKMYSDCHVNQKRGEVHDFGLQFQSKDIPAPIATKMFYSMRNQRLRSAIKCMYYESFSEEHSDDVHVNASKGDGMELQVSFPSNFSGELKDQIKKAEKQPLHSTTSAKKPELVLGDCSDVYIGKLGHILIQDPMSNSNSQATSLGNMRSNYPPKSSLSAGNSGSSHGTMQQPKERVPVT